VPNFWTWALQMYWRLNSSNLMDAVDELNGESVKYNKYQNMAVKQFQDKTRWLQRRQHENSTRTARGEDPLPDEDVSTIFKPIVLPSRLKSLVLSGQILSSEQISQFCSESLAKLFSIEPLHKAKMSMR